jgi:hypothetical protein
MTADEFTADQIAEAIHRAVREARFDVIESLFRMLALRDPGRAEDLHGTYRIAVAIAQHPRARPAAE